MSIFPEVNEIINLNIKDMLSNIGVDGPQLNKMRLEKFSHEYTIHILFPIPGASTLFSQNIRRIQLVKSLRPTDLSGRD
jgi:hypothetical protein